MELETLLPRISLIDGMRANYCGEWPGIKSSKWTSSVRVLRPEPNQLFDDQVIVPIYARRHFEQQTSREFEFKPHQRLFNALKSRVNIEEKKKGVKPIEYSFSVGKDISERKHFNQTYGEEKFPPVFNIKTFRPDGNYTTDKFSSIDYELGQKKRVLSLDQQRNGIKTVNPGDKLYKFPEHLFNFFKEGGIVPGSSNTFNRNKTTSKKTFNFYDTLDLNVKLLDENKFWHKKVLKEQLDQSQNYMKTLINWENTTLKEFNPNWNKKPEPPKKGAGPGNKTKTTKNIPQINKTKK